MLTVLSSFGSRLDVGLGSVEGATGLGVEASLALPIEGESPSFVSCRTEMLYELLYLLVLNTVRCASQNSPDQLQMKSRRPENMGTSVVLPGRVH